jgi:hypothetical protein
MKTRISFVRSDARRALFAVCGVMVSVTHLADAQSAPAGPTLSDGFSFPLGPYRDEAITQTIDALKKHDEFHRARDHESANKDIFFANHRSAPLRAIPTER